MAEKEKKYLKYFTIPLDDAREWDFKDYIAFLIEALWMTVFPFVAGMLLVARKQLVWLLMLVLPIYFRIKVQKKLDRRKSMKRIYVK